MKLMTELVESLGGEIVDVEMHRIECLIQSGFERLRLEYEPFSGGYEVSDFVDEFEEMFAESVMLGNYVTLVDYTFRCVQRLLKEYRRSNRTALDLNHVRTLGHTISGLAYSAKRLIESRIFREMRDLERAEQVEFLTELFHNLPNVCSNETKDLIKNELRSATSMAEIRNGKAEGNDGMVNEAPVGKPCTADRAVMILYYFGGSRVLGLSKGRVAELASALTGHSVSTCTNAIGRVWPNDEKLITKYDQNPKAYRDDVDYVATILDRIGLGIEARKVRETA